MSTTTTKLALVKPDPTENVDIAVINSNMDKIDAGFSSIAPSFRNKIRNGDMSIAQRGGGAVNTSSARTVDGWMMLFTGGGCQHIRSALAVGSALTEATWTLKTDITGQSAAGDFFITAHRIEGVRTLAGKQATLSFLARAGSGTPKIGVELEQVFGTGGTGTIVSSIGAITISTTLTRYSITFTVPTVAGKTIGTSNNDDYLGINLWMSAGSTYAGRASNIGIQNTAALEITDVQLEEGSVATAFERLPQQVQLAWCQRYFTRWTQIGGNNVYIGTGSWANSTVSNIVVLLPVQMRTPPSVGWSNPTVFGVQNGIGGFATTALAAANTSSTSALLQPTCTGGAAGAQGAFFYTAGAGAYLEMSAEL